jgi:hypothetical protein
MQIPRRRFLSSGSYSLYSCAPESSVGLEYTVWRLIGLENAFTVSPQ